MSEEQNNNGQGRDYIKDFKDLISDAEQNFSRGVGASSVDPAMARQLMIASTAQSSLATAIGVGILVDIMRMSQRLVVGPPPGPMVRKEEK